MIIHYYSFIINLFLSVYQFIFVLLFAIKYSFDLEKWEQPKKPLYDDSGEGCVDSSIKCFWASSIFEFFLAFPPHKIKTTFSQLSSMCFITFFVKRSHPIFLWESGLFSVTVNTLFKRKTPWLAHFVKFPVLGMWMGSLGNSLPRWKWTVYYIILINYWLFFIK